MNRRSDTDSRQMAGASLPTVHCPPPTAPRPTSAVHCSLPAACCRPGFTLVEILVAMTITVILGMVVVMAYNTGMQAYVHTEKKLQALAAFRNTADRLEREVNSCVFKAGVWERPVTRYDGLNHYNVWYETMVKYINADPASPNPGITRLVSSPLDLRWQTATDGRSMYQINFRPRYLGYYSTLDGFTIDRAELYYNPPEDRQVWDNGLDDDDDDPDGDAGLRILYDDKGCLMFRKKFDRDMVWAEWYDPETNKFPDGTKAYAPRLGASNMYRRRPNDYRDPYHGPYSLCRFPPPAEELAGPLTAEQIMALLADPNTIKSDQGNDEQMWAASKGVGTPLDAAGYAALSKEDKRKANLASGYIVDTGTVIGEGFSDLRFYYLYKHQATDRFVYADWWPWDDDNNPTTPNGKDTNIPSHVINHVIQTGAIHASNGACPVCGQNHAWNPPPPDAHDQGAVPFDITYMTLPMAISVQFTFTVNHQKHVYEKLIYLQASRWLMYLNP